MTQDVDRSEIAEAFARAAETARSGRREERSGRVRPLSSVTVLRQGLNLSRDEFAACYRVPIEKLRAWERGDLVPDDAIAQALLDLVAADPKGTAAALAAAEAIAAK